MNGFEAFWLLYPKKIGKLAAMKSYEKALTMATPEAILEGVERYKKHKPDYADFCYPATFLNQGRWMDEYDEKPASKSPVLVYTEWTCPHVERCAHRSQCRDMSILGRPQKAREAS